jgi:hypothetical protein
LRHEPVPRRERGLPLSDRLHHGRLKASIADVLDLGLDVLPHYELAVIPLLDGAERPAEWPDVKRRLRAEGVRTSSHRGALLLEPGEMDRFASVGLLTGNDELLLCTEWQDEFESFPGRVGGEADFNEGTPLGLEEWMIDSGCLLVLGDGAGLNFATLDDTLAERLRARFPAATD